jgi:hypothetical protein
VRILIVLALVVFLFTSPIHGTRIQSSSGACDRECLRGFVTRYFDALVAHKPGDLPVSPAVKFTEDTVEMKLGEGLWKNATKRTPYRLDVMPQNTPSGWDAR